MTAARACLVAAVLLLALAPPAHAADSTPPDIGVAVNGPRGQDGWFTGNVLVNWTVFDPDSGFTVDEGCEPSTTIAHDTAGDVEVCRASSEGGTASKTITVRRDATPPALAPPAADRPPDADGWYNRAVGVTWSGTDATSGVASCASTTYAGPDTAAATLGGTCADRAGNAADARTLTLRFDATPPVVTGAVPARPGNPGGWFTAPVDLVWTGTDATSGIAGCTSLTYAGPDADPGRPAGSCADRAGNRSAPTTAPIRYDATAPQLDALRARRRARGRARISWRAEGASAVRVLRRPGRDDRQATVVYSGAAAAFTDRDAEPGTRYTYVVEATDPAGNVRSATTVLPSSARTPLLAPADGARVGRRPVLRWRAVGRASFYNVQIFRGRRKLLTIWPARARLRLPRRLAAGRYRWYVWPAFGSRKAPRYGPLLVRGTFVVR